MAGFHNQIVHHILTILALRATAEEIEPAYMRDSSYQKPARRVDETIVESLRDRKQFTKHLRDAQNYHNFLADFQCEIDRKGVHDVLNEYLLKEDERVDEMLLRMFTGLFHPIIHLGFGLEFNQPAIVAEGLAQACLDRDWIGLRRLLPEAEKSVGGAGPGAGQKRLFQLLDEIEEDKRLGQSQMTLSIHDHGRPDEKLVEMINVVFLLLKVYYTAAAWGSRKFDFVCLHAVNSSIFFSTLLALPSLTRRTKFRLLEWKGRMDLIMYVEQKVGPSSMSSITDAQIWKDWPAIFRAGCVYGDDEHTAKLIRAVEHAERVCRPYEGKKDWRIWGDMLLKICNLIIR